MGVLVMKNRIKELRLKNGLRQSGLALKLNLNVDTLRSYEKGKTKPAEYTWRHIANVFNTTVPYVKGQSSISYPVDRWQCHKCKKYFWVPVGKKPDCCPICGSESSIGYGVKDEVMNAGCDR